MRPMAKYKKEYCDTLLEHMGFGRSFESFGKVVDVCHRTLYNWVEEKPEFQEAKLRGELRALYEWETIGLQGMRGEIKGFNPVSWIFLGKCRFRKYGYKDHVEDDAIRKEPDKAEAVKALEELKTMLRDQQCQPMKQSLPESSAPQLASGLLGESSKPKSMDS